ncbi:MAG: hypothetical protein LBV18_04550 [Alistipes sp.]|jgi:hypothetical protein|nr:hypothetical protein [Alistipes sp.]
MRNLYILSLAVTIAAMAASCSPRVVANISRPLPPLDPNEMVVVREEPLPENARLVGTVSVSDTGASTGCSYAQVLGLAIGEARKAGGNRLYVIDHRVPDIVSSCHQIVAAIVHFDGDEEEIESDRYADEYEPRLEPMQPASQSEGRYAEPESQEGIGFRQRGEREYHRTRYSGGRQGGHHSGYVGRHQDYYAPPEMKLPKSRIALDIMYSARIFDRGVSGLDSRAESDLANGFSWGFAAAGFSNDIHGFGGKIVGSHYSSDLVEGGCNINMFYFAPEYVARIADRNNVNMWVFSCSLGPVVYDESTGGVDINRIGFRTGLDIGYDFRVGEGVWMGLKAGLYSGSIRLSDDYGISLNSFEIGGGLRF